MEGLNSPNVLIERLSSLINEYEINLVSARADRFEASINRSLRSQQDEAFLESLRADQEKERRREEQRIAEQLEIRRLEEVSIFVFSETAMFYFINFQTIAALLF